jgi:hypothetical protein
MRTAPAVRLVPRSLASSSMTRWTSRRLVPARRTALASGSSHGVPFKDRPSIDITACVHSRRTGARGCHLSSAFRPCRFARLRRFAPQPTGRFVAPCCRPWGSPGFEPTVDGHAALLGFRRSSAADCRGASEDALRPGVSRQSRSSGVTNRRSSDPPHRCVTLRSFPLSYSGSPCLQGSSLPVVVRFAPKSSTSLDLKAFSVEESVAPEADESTTGPDAPLGFSRAPAFTARPGLLRFASPHRSDGCPPHCKQCSAGVTAFPRTLLAEAAVTDWTTPGFRRHVRCCLPPVAEAAGSSVPKDRPCFSWGLHRSVQRGRCVAPRCRGSTESPHPKVPAEAGR